LRECDRDISIWRTPDNIFKCTECGVKDKFVSYKKMSTSYDQKVDSKEEVDNDIKSSSSDNVDGITGSLDKI